MAQPVVTPALAGFVAGSAPVYNTQSEHPLDMHTPTTIVSLVTRKCEPTQPLSWLDGEPVEDAIVPHHVHDGHAHECDPNVAEIVKSFKWSTNV